MIILNKTSNAQTEVKRDKVGPYKSKTLYFKGAGQ